MWSGELPSANLKFENNTELCCYICVCVHVYLKGSKFKDDSLIWNPVIESPRPLFQNADTQMLSGMRSRLGIRASRC